MMAKPSCEARGEHDLLAIPQPDSSLLMDELAKEFEVALIHRDEIMFVRKR